MVVIFIITYLLAVVNVLYVALWHIYKSWKHKVVNVEEEFPIYNNESTKTKVKDDSKKPGKAFDDAIPTWRYTPDSARTSTLTHRQDTERSFFDRINPFKKRDDNAVKPFDPEGTGDGFSHSRNRTSDRITDRT